MTRQHTAKNRENQSGALFVVATPIGNLGDITLRAIETLRQAELILAEDTRRASILLQSLNIRTAVQSLHQHNEAARLPALLTRLQRGARVALISDAGTPLISDPGARLVRAAREHKIVVTPLPGASALTAALSVCPQQDSERFCFEGFLPAKAAAREQRLRELASEPRALVLFEASHRITDTLNAIAACFGGTRMLSVAREISKKFESFYSGSADEVRATIASDALHRKGEFVIIIAGASASQMQAHTRTECRTVMQLLMAEMPLKRAAEIAAQCLQHNRNELYQIGLALKNEADDKVDDRAENKE